MWKAVFVLAVFIVITNATTTTTEVYEEPQYSVKCPEGRKPGDSWVLESDPCSSCDCLESGNYECSTCDHIIDDTYAFNTVPPGCDIGPKQTGPYPECCLDSLVCEGT